MDAEKQLLRQRFWFLVVFSGLLIVLFALYLPERFYWEATSVGMRKGVGEHGEEVFTDGAMHGDGHGEYDYHEEADILFGFAINLTATPTPVTAGQPVRLDFFVHEKRQTETVAVSDLEVEHERLMHVIGVRSDLNEFFHIHPAPTETPGLFSISHTFRKPGAYKIWSEAKQDGVIHVVGHPELVVGGVGPAFEKNVSYARNVIVERYQVNLDFPTVAVKGVSYDVSFDIHTLTGGEVRVEPYLGADMHLSIIRDDWKEFLHIHPEEGGDLHAASSLISVARAHGADKKEGRSSSAGGGGSIKFHITFPESGLYKAFAQFRPAGAGLGQDEALTAEFWMRVEDSAPRAVSDRWLLLFGSIVLIVVLSFIVKKYILVTRVDIASQTGSK